jgi:hypothetical protein
VEGGYDIERGREGGVMGFILYTKPQDESAKMRRKEINKMLNSLLEQNNKGLSQRG